MYGMAEFALYLAVRYSCIFNLYLLIVGSLLILFPHITTLTPNHFAFSTFNNDLIELHLLMHIRPSEYLKSTIVKYARDKLVLLVNISLKDYLQQNIINRFVQLLK